MITSGKPFTTITFEDGSIAVVRADFRKPRFLELIAIFYEASRARSYAEIENGGLAEELPIELKKRPGSLQKPLNTTMAQQPRSRRISALAKAPCCRRSAKRWMKTSGSKRKRPPWPRLPTYRLDRFIRCCNRWRKRSSSRWRGQAPRKRPLSMRCYDAHLHADPKR